MARFDGRFERTTSTLAILGLWLEDETLARDEAFVEAFAIGMDRMQQFLGADVLDASGVPQRPIRSRLARRESATFQGQAST